MHAQDTPSTLSGRRYAPWKIMWPIGLIVVVLIAANALAMGVRLYRPYCVNPWESSLVCDAWRAMKGMPVYTEVAADHATTMYGALYTYTLSWVFQAAGANNYAGRVLALVSALAVTTLLATALTRGQRGFHFFVAWGLLFSINLLTANYFVETRPDMLSLFFCLLAMLLFYQGYHGSRWGVYSAGAACLVVALLFKQPSAMFSVVPGLAMLIQRDRPFSRQVLFAALPVAAVIATLVVMRFTTPLVYFYMVKVPRPPLKTRFLAEFFFGVLSGGFFLNG